jgi:hypothetical protein
MRTKFIDFDARHEPKTVRFCIRCQRDIKPGQPARMVHVLDGPHAIHPEDEPAQIQPAEDTGWWLLGMECARILGMEWTHDVAEERLVSGGIVVPVSDKEGCP